MTETSKRLTKLNKAFNWKPTRYNLHLDSVLGVYSRYYSVLIVRGIGYRVLFHQNSLAAPNSLENEIDVSNAAWNKNAPVGRKRTINPITLEFLLDHNIKLWSWIYSETKNFSRVLELGLGHAFDQCVGLAGEVALHQRKKNRKLIFSSWQNYELKNITRRFFDHRQPSVYTGRGVRRKKIKPRKKLGKKDARKGKGRVF